jgi:hypothetical protein
LFHGEEDGRNGKQWDVDERKTEEIDYDNTASWVAPASQGDLPQPRTRKEETRERGKHFYLYSD